MTLLAGIRIVPDPEITRYLLDPEHRVGGPKAQFFMAFGFDRDRPEEFVAALLLHANTHPIFHEAVRRGGTNRALSDWLQTPDRRNPHIVAVWYQADDEMRHRLVADYPA